MHPSGVGGSLPQNRRADVEILRQSICINLVWRAGRVTPQPDMAVILGLIRAIRSIDRLHDDTLLQTHATVVPVQAGIKNRAHTTAATNPSRQRPALHRPVAIGLEKIPPRGGISFCSTSIGLR